MSLTRNACRWLPVQGWLLAALPICGAEIRMEEGQRFPDLALPSVKDGQLVKLSSFNGKKVLLQIFASW